jgi:DNA-binding LacI/PurR family transcriptional regulator
MGADKKRRPGRPASPESRYRRVAGELRARIDSGEFPAGQPLPALRSLAEHYRTGQHTVRMAVDLLRREGRVRSGRGRRLVVAAAGAMRSPLDGPVVLVASFPLDVLGRSPYLGDLLRGIELGVGEVGAPLVVPPGGEFYREPPEELLDLAPRGLILIGVFPDETLAGYEKLAVPVVLVDQPAPGRRLHTATVDNRPAAREATRRILDLGHRRIAFVRQVQLGARRVDPDARERQEGFLEALKEAGVPRRTCEVVNFLPGDSEESPAMRRLFREGSEFTAALTVSGGLAEHVAAAARSAGRRIPEEFSLVCLRGRHPSFSRFSGPRLDFEEVGRRAVGLLEAPRSPPQHVRVPAEWVDAGSLAAPPGKS